MSDGKTPLLLECGIPWRQIKIALNFHTSDIAACLVSHAHMDHCKAVKDVVKSGMDIYMSPTTASILGQSGHRVRHLEHGGQVTIGGWIVKAFRTEHDIEGSLGFLLHSKATGERLSFITDSYFSRYVFRDLTHIMLEINYDLQTLNKNVDAGRVPQEMKSRLIKSHFSLEHAVDFLRANDLRKVKEIHIIHMSDGNANEQRIRETIQRITGKPVIVAG